MMSVWRAGFDRLRNSGLPEFVVSAGKSVFERQRRADDAILALKEKLRHEVAQVFGAETRAELLDELADVLDVAHALAKARGISSRELETRRSQRNEPAPRTMSAAPRGAASAQRAIDARPGVAPVSRAGALAVLRPGFSRGLSALRGSLIPRLNLAAHGGSAKRAVDGARFRRGVIRASAEGALATPGATRTRRVFAGAATFLDGAGRSLNAKQWRAVAYAPLARLRVRGVAPVLVAPQAALVIAPAKSVRLLRLPQGRSLPVALVGGGSQAAVWIVSLTSRAMFRYVVRPYLVRYATNRPGASRVDQGSRALIRLMLPSLTA